MASGIYSNPDPAEEKRRRIIWLGFGIRAGISLLAFFVTVFIKARGWISADILPVLIIATINIALNLPYMFLYFLLGSPKRLIGLYVATDTLFIAIISHYYGGIDAFFSLYAYIFVIVFCAFYLGKEIARTITTLACVAYGTVILLEYSGLIPHYPTEVDPFSISLAGQAILVVFNIALMVLICWFSVRVEEVEEKLERRSVALEEANYKIKAQNTNLIEMVQDRTLELQEKNTRLEGALMDIQEMKERLSIEERMRSMGQFVDEAAHALKTPVSLVKLLLESAQKKAKSGGSPIRELDQAVERCEELQEYVAELLSLHSPMTISSRRINIHNLLKICMSMLDEKSLGDNNNIDIKWDLRADKTILYGDFSQLQHLFMNLISNATEAMPDGGMLSLATVDRNGGIDISIKDTGTGVSVSDMKKVFEPFYSTKQGSRGNGLGLAIAKRITERHGGEIGIQNGSEQGTQLVVSLPHDPPIDQQSLD